ncbi:hypothetical protein ACQWF0_24490, partial [Salmonella enterica subsp. enterica serovar Infantis]
GTRVNFHLGARGLVFIALVCGPLGGDLVFGELFSFGKIDFFFLFWPGVFRRNGGAQTVKLFPVCFFRTFFCY